MSTQARWDWRVEGVFVAVWVGLAVAAYGLGFRPEADARRRASSAQERLISCESDRDKVRAQAESARRRLDKAQELRDQSSVRLQQASQINQRLAALSAISEEAGVKLDQLEPGKPAPYPRYTVVPVKLAGSASYAGLVELFRRLHDQFPDTRAPQFKLSANLDAAKPTGRFAIDLVWYAAPQSARRAAPAKNP